MSENTNDSDEAIIRIELPNNEIYEISVEDAAHLLARQRVDTDSDDVLEEFEEEAEFYMQAPDELRYDIQGYLDWDEVSPHATLVESPDPDYQDQWMEADVSVRDH